MSIRIRRLATLFADMSSSATPSTRLSVESISFSALETEEMAERVRDVKWGTEYIARGRSFAAEVAVLQTQRAQLARNRFHSACLSRGECPPDSYVFALSTTQVESSRLGGESFGPDKIGVLRSGMDHEFCAAAGEEVLMLVVSREWVERETRARWGRPLSELAHHWTFACRDPRTVRLLRASWSRLFEKNPRQSDRIALSETTRQIEEELPRELLRAIAPPLPGTSAPDRRRAARRAEGYIRENMHRSISLGDLCRVGNANERALREGFVELYGFSPLPYLKTLRLQTARTELQKGGHDRRISDIALACGFTHLGRFSVAYRQLFGEKPSETQGGRRRAGR